MLMTVKYGSTRIVILVSNYAIKLPYIFYFRNFLHGILANHQENLFYQSLKSEKLCPVIKIPYYLFAYLFIIMKKAEPITREDFNNVNFEQFIEDNGFMIPVENKLDSFGYYKGRLVAIDYGT